MNRNSLLAIGGLVGTVVIVLAYLTCGSGAGKYGSKECPLGKKGTYGAGKGAYPAMFGHGHPKKETALSEEKVEPGALPPGKKECKHHKGEAMAAGTAAGGKHECKHHKGEAMAAGTAAGGKHECKHHKGEAMVPGSMAGGKHECNHHSGGGSAMPCEHQQAEGGIARLFIDMYKKHANDLELTEEQIEQLSRIERESKGEWLELAGDIKVARVDLNVLLAEENAPMEDIRKKVREIHQIKEKLEMAHYQGLARAREVMSDDQRKKCEKLCMEKTGKPWPMIH